jgi:uncharacterized lipoprotein YajG
MKHTFTLFLLFLLLFSCQKQKETSSVTDEQTSKIMADMCMAEAATHTMTGFEKDSLVQIYYDQVFKINKLSKADHERNIRILSRDVLRMEAILLRTEKMLEEKKQ